MIAAEGLGHWEKTREGREEEDINRIIWLGENDRTDKRKMGEWRGEDAAYNNWFYLRVDPQDHRSAKDPLPT